MRKEAAMLWPLWALILLLDGAAIRISSVWHSGVPGSRPPVDSVGRVWLCAQSHSFPWPRGDSSESRAHGKAQWDTSYISRWTDILRAVHKSGCFSMLKFFLQEKNQCIKWGESYNALGSFSLSLCFLWFSLYIYTHTNTHCMYICIYIKKISI